MSNKQIMGFAAFLRTLFRYLRPYRLQTFLLLFFLLVDLTFSVAWPLSFKFLIDNAIADKNRTVLFVTLGVLLAGVILAALASVGRDYCYAFLSAHVLNDVRLKVFRHLQVLSAGFYARTGTGDLMARFSSDLAALETAITWAIASLILNSMSILLCAALLFALEWHLALLTLFGLVLCIIIPRGLARRASQMSYETKQQEASLANIVQENVSTQAVIKAFALEDHAIKEFTLHSASLATIARRFSFLTYLVERVPNILILIFEILVIGTGVLLVFYDYLTLGTMVAFHALFINISASVGGLTNVLPVILHSIGGLQRIEELLAEESEVKEAPGATALPRLSQAIGFNDVSFSYTGEQKNLDRISFEIPRGTFVAFVGSSGSGKSTVLNLILRFYDPLSGELTFDGENIRRATLASLRAQIGVVFQESILFNISLRENIRLGRPEATEKEVEEAARAAEFHEDIRRLPQGYGTLVGERGGRISGGQRQRVAIARALLRDPEILLLDEATSALDPETESAINATLEHVGHGRTVVAVTHRLSSVIRADCIFVLQEGRLIERGKHEELVDRGGLYSQLWRKQSGFALSEGGEHAHVEANRLRSYPILEKLDESMLAEIAPMFVTEVYRPDRLVVEEGDPGDRFYLIVRGKVSVLKTDRDGVQKQVEVLDDGDYFGEIALLKNVPRTATIRTLTSCVFLSLRREQFQQMLDQAPHMREVLEATLLSRMQVLASPS